MNDCTILHCDLNNFYASVECILNPALKEKYVAVCGNKEHRHGIVLAKNQLAKEKGVQTGDTIIEAQKKCPELVIVPPHYEEYVNYAKKVHKIYKEYSDKVESFGFDECWIDITNTINLFGNAKTIADNIRAKVKKETGLTISVGVSFCKTFAKLGSDLKKPDATTIISKSNFKETVWPLPINYMLMIGKKTTEKLKKYNIYTLEDLAKADTKLLKSLLGANGLQIKKLANGEEETIVTQVDISQPIKSLGHGTTTIIDVKDYQTAKQVILFLSDMIAVRLRQNGLLCNGISLTIKYNNLSSISKQCKLPTKTFNATTIANVAYKLLFEIWKGPLDIPLRLIGINTYDLVDVAQNTQESLFDNPQEEINENLDFTIDKIRKKYGYSIITKGTTLNNNNIMTDKSPIKDTEFIPFKKLT